MKTFIFDIESNNFLDKMTTIHCIVIQDYDSGEIFKYRPNEIKRGLKKLQEADRLVAHNGLDFDIRAIKKMYPRWTYKGQVYDTLIAAKYAFPDIKERDFGRLRKIISKPQKMRTKEDKAQLKMIGRHSLEAYGQRLGELKGDFGKEVGFEVFSEEMLDYCVQDVRVNTKLYHKLVSMELNQDVLDLEFKAKEICLEQTSFGFQFNKKAALELQDTLQTEMTTIQDEIKSILGGPFIIPLEVKVPKRTVKYKDILRGHEMVGCPFTKIKVKDFNPTSRHDLSTRLIERCGWKPKEFGNDGKPTLSEEVLIQKDERIYKLIAKQMMIQKRLGMLADGNNAWLKMYNEETQAIHGNIDTLGTGTHRCTHSRPNLGQIPSTRAPYGKECRSLFTVPKGWKLFGTDASGLELRVLAHYMHAFDGGAYADIILNGDIHTTNQEAAGLATRNQAKTYMYAKIYGSGIANLAKVCGVTEKVMRQKVKNFDKNLPALKELTDKVKEMAEYRGYVKALDGRRIPVRSAHSALNFLLQSGGAIICKNWMVNMHVMMAELGYSHGEGYRQSAYVHDECQWAYDPNKCSEELLSSISKKAMIKAGVDLGVKIPLDVGCDFGNTYADTH